MSTVVGLRCRDGVVLAGDRRLVRGGHVASTSRQHVFEVVAGVGVAAVGSDVDRFVDRLRADLKRYRLERDEPSLAVVERLASDAASDVGVIVAARDEAGTAGLRAIHADGSTLSDPVVALGTGASLALGQLEAVDSEGMSAAEAEPFLTELFAAVAERDPGTGAETDGWSLLDR